MSLVIKTADELLTAEALARLAARRAARDMPLVRTILRAFAERGGPVAVRDLGAERGALAALDDEDVIRLRGDVVDMAYPFSAAPTAFLVRLPGGRDRYACCATDALGFAPMLGEAVEIRSRCHQSGSPLAFSVSPEGPGPEAGPVMLWIGERGDEACKAADGL